MSDARELIKHLADKLHELDDTQEELFKAVDAYLSQPKPKAYPVGYIGTGLTIISAEEFNKLQPAMQKWYDKPLYAELPKADPADGDLLTAAYMCGMHSAKKAPKRETGMSVIGIADDASLRFVQRVLESEAPQADRAVARQMITDIRTRVRSATPGIIKRERVLLNFVELHETIRKARLNFTKRDGTISERIAREIEQAVLKVNGIGVNNDR